MTPETKANSIPPPNEESLLKRTTFHEMRDHKVCQTNLGDVISELEEAIKNPENNNAVLLYNPARIINSILAGKVECDRDQTLRYRFEALIVPSVEMAISVYKEEKDALSKLKELNSLIDYSNLDSLRLRAVIEKPDELKIQAFTTERTKTAVNHLKSITKGNPVLFLSFANGGTGPGLYDFVEYTKQTGRKDSTFYPIRFEHSLHDRLPKVSSSEIDWLKKQAEGKQVTVFNDHSVSGATIGIGIPYVREIIFGRCKKEGRFLEVIPLTNDPDRQRRHI
ncbi:MAG: hypothetical protein V1697_03055 [Candidatus Levyibacteriota bacterium]